MTIDLYGHLFLSEADTIPKRLDDTLRISQTDKRAGGPLEVLGLAPMS